MSVYSGDYEENKRGVEWGRGIFSFETENRGVE